MKPVSDIRNCDCMDYMASVTDKFFDLAIVDPPYGIGAGKMTMGSGVKHWSKSNWDSKILNMDYFNSLFRVSKNQIIWGGNYFTEYLPPKRGWLSWNKEVPNGMSFADFELAWTSFDMSSREIRIKYSGSVVQGKYEIKIHPTQKPVALYVWLLKNYAKQGDRIFDSHLGSGSSRIAAYKLGFDFYATEIDETCFNEQEKRFRKACFNEIEITKRQVVTQKSLFDN